MRKLLYRWAVGNRPTATRVAGFKPQVLPLEDRAVPAVFTFANVAFDTVNEPDNVSLLPIGTYSGAVVTSLPSTAIQADVNFPDPPTSGFSPNSSLGTRLFPSAGAGSRALNLPSGNNGTTERSGIELSFSAARALGNAAGADFIDYESASNVNAGLREPEPVMIQAYVVNTGTWTKWYFNTASTVSHYTNDANQGAYATKFDLTDMGVASGAYVSKIRLVNLTGQDRLETNQGIGFVLPNDTSGSTFLPSTGPLSDFPTYTAANLDPDPIYFGGLNPVSSNISNVQVKVTQSPAGTIASGGNVTYTVTVTNLGPATAGGVPLTFNPPAGLTNVTYTSVNDGSASGNTPAGSNGIGDTLRLPGYSQIVYTVTGKISPSQIGPVTVTFTAGSPTLPTTDVNPGDSTATLVTPVTSSGDLVVTVASNPPVAGQPETYTVTVVNNGPSNFGGVTIANTVSPLLTGVTFTSVASNGATGNGAGSGAPNEQIILPATGKVVYTIVGSLPPGASGTLPFTSSATPPSGATDPTPADAAVMINPAIARTGDLAIAISSNASSVPEGGTVVYTIVASNPGPSTATAPVQSNNFSATFTSVSYSSVAAGGATGNSVNGIGDLNEMLTLPPNSKVTYTVTGKLSNGTTGPLTTTVQITAPGGFSDPTVSNNNAMNTVTVVPSADINVTVSANPTTGSAGGPVTYTVTVTNNGPSGATGVPLTFTPPAGLTGVTYTSTPTGGASGNTNGTGAINDTLALPATGKIVYTVTGTIAANAPNPLVTTFAAGSPAGPTVDPNLADNAKTFSLPTQSVGDLQVTVVPGPAIAGSPTTYTITVKNAGPSPLTGVPVVSAAPGNLSNVTFTSVPGNGATGNTNGAGGINNTLTLPSGGFVTYTVTGTIPSNATGTVNVIATATPPAGSSDPTPADATANTSTAITRQGDLQVTISSNGQTQAVTGTKVTYTVVVTNAGPSLATSAVLSDAFSSAFSGVTFTSVAAGGATGNTASGSGDLNEILTLPGGSTATYTVVGTLTSGPTGPLTTTAKITAPSGFTDPNLNNNAASSTVTIIPGANVGVVVTPSSPTAPNGGVLTYTVEVSNTGPSAASGVSVASLLPPGLTGVTYTSVASGGASGNRTAGLGDLADSLTLPSGGKVTYIVKGTVQVGLTGDLTSTFSATNPAGLADPDPSDNSVTITTPVRPSPKVIYAASTGGSVTTQVFVFNANGSQRFSYQPYDTRFTRGVNVGIGDVNGDGFPDVVTGAAAGGGSHVRAVNGNDGADLFSFFGYGSTVRTGVNVAVGDVNGDGRADIVTGSDTGGGPRIRVFDMTRGGQTGVSVLDFFAFDQSIRTGVRVAVGDIDGDGIGEIIASQGQAFNGVGGSSEVRIFNGRTGQLISSFLAFDANSSRGVYVTAADLDGDAKAEIIVGNGSTGTPTGKSQPLVRVFAPSNDNAQIREFYAYETGFRGGVRVATFADDSSDLVTPPTRIIVGPGPGGGPRLRQFDAIGNDRGSQYLINPNFRGGLFVG